MCFSKALVKEVKTICMLTGNMRRQCELLLSYGARIRVQANY